MELETTKIIYPQCFDRYELNELRKKIAYDIPDVSDVLLRRCMAYGGTPNQVKAVLRAMATKEKVDDNSSLTETRAENSFGSVFESLRQLRSKLDSKSGPSLFQAVLGINENEIDVSFSNFSF